MLGANLNGPRRSVLVCSSPCEPGRSSYQVGRLTLGYQTVFLGIRRDSVRLRARQG